LVVFSNKLKYSSIVYLELGRIGWNLVQSTNPTITIRFPIVDDSKGLAQETKSKSRKTVTDQSGWVTSKPKKAAATTRKSKTVTKRPSKAKTTRASTSTKSSRLKKAQKTTTEPEVIDILSSDDDADSDDPPLMRTLASAPGKGDDMCHSTSEEEF
jgi:hypothetical protein